MRKIIYIITVFIAVSLYSCDPQKDDAIDIGKAPTGDFSIDNSDPNNIVFNAPTGLLYRWEFFGAAPTSHIQTPTVNYPFVGDYKVALILSGKGGATTIEKTVTIMSNDPTVGQKPLLKELTGGGAGKTWVYDKGNVDGYFYMTANYDWEEFWWQPADDGDIPAGINSELKFDLDGGYNYTLSENANTPGEKKSFVLNADDMTITFVNSNLPDADDENLNPDRAAKNVYQIKMLTDGELLLWQDQQNDDYAWAWRFKPKE